MIGTLLARFGVSIGSGFIKASIVAGLAALAAFGFWRGMARIDDMVTEAHRSGVEESNAKWKAEIEKANRAVLELKLQHDKQTAERDLQAQTTISTLQQSLAEIEARNAALPNANRVGLSRDRVRLLRDGLKSRPPNPDSGTPPIRPFILEGAVRGPGSPP